jgi:hypothetical protein
MLGSKAYASSKRQGAYEDFFGIHTCRKFNMILDHVKIEMHFRVLGLIGPMWYFLVAFVIPSCDLGKWKLFMPCLP